MALSRPTMPALRGKPEADASAYNFRWTSHSAALMSRAAAAHRSDPRSCPNNNDKARHIFPHPGPGHTLINRTYRPVVTIHDEREAARHARGCVAIIDDDDAIREAVKTLLDLEGYATETYASAMHYVDVLQQNEPSFPGPRCILLDVKMPEHTGLDLQNRLNALSDKTPLVFMSGGSGAHEAVQALKNGAIDFLIKPFEEEALLAAVSEALQKSLNQQAHLREDKDNSSRLASLSERESQIAHMVSKGMLNRDIAGSLGIAVRTVKLHRMHMMRKLGVSNVIELARIIDKAG